MIPRTSVPSLFMGDVIVFFGTFALAFVAMKLLAKLLSRPPPQTTESEGRKLPGPWPWPIVGNAPSLGEAPHLTFDEMAKVYGPIFGIKIGTVPVVVLNNNKVIRAALNKQRITFSGRPRFASYKLISLGIGAVFNDSTTMGDGWHTMKMKMVKHIHTYASSVDKRLAVSQHICDEIEYIMETLEKQCAESPTGFVDPEQAVRVSVGNAVCAMCFGRRYQVDNPQFVQLLSMNREFGVVISAGSRVDVMPWMKIFPYYRKAAKEFEALCQRMESWVLEKVTENTKTYTPGTIRNLIDAMTEGELSEFYERQKSMSNGAPHDDPSRLEDIPIIDRVDHRFLSALVNDVFGAGQDTLSSAFLFILHYMIRYPDIQKRIREDLHKLTGGKRLPALSDRVQLPFLEAVFHEVMRHSSFAAIAIPHRTLATTVLCGFKIPKDTMVFVNQYAANRDASMWDDPYSFKPDRFLKIVDGTCQLDPLKVNKYTIFSTGARKCPGDELSKIWVIHAMALILHQCQLEADPDNQPTDAICYGLTMKPRNLRVRLTKLKS